MNKPHLLGRLLPLAVLSFLAPAALAQTPFTIGNIVVVRVGDGGAALSTASAPCFLDEYTTSGTFVQTIALPTVASGSNLPFSSSGSLSSEGFLNVSENGIYLLLGGYGETPGVSGAVARTDSTVVPRVIAVVDIAGNVDTSTALTDAYSSTGSSNSPLRSVLSTDGSQFWTSGTGQVFASAGMRYVANVGATTSVQLNGASTNNRAASMFLGQLYTTTASGANIGVNTVGTGLPTTAGQPVTLLNGFPGLSAPDSPYDMFWADPNTLYVADDRTNGLGGIQKWTQTAGTWTLQYTIGYSSIGGTTGMRSLTGQVLNGVTTLWATANYAFPNNTTEIVTCVDTGAGSVVTSLATAPLNVTYRGIRRIGQPTNLQRFATSCGAASLECSGSGEMGTSLFTQMNGTVGLVPMIALDITSSFLPLNFVFANCNCTLGVGVNPVLMITGTSFPLNIQPSWATLGLPVFIQGIDLLTPPGGPCPDLLDLTLTDTWSFTVQ
jgi:hypothetical protein